MSDLEKVTELVNAVAAASAVQDDEVAHHAEDEAWATALAWVAERGDVAAREIATAALQSRRYEFRRWTS